MNYWLFKSEPNVFSIDDLEKSPGATSGWEGIRNYQARNFLRDSVKLGDRVLFYHSKIEPIGIVGSMKIVREAYPDHFAFDKTSQYYDKKSKPENPTWYMVDVKLTEKFPKILPLRELKLFKELSKMVLFQKGSRLSIQPVTESEFNFIIKLKNS